MEKYLEAFGLLIFLVVMSGVCGYVSVFKPLKRLLELLVVKKNPFSLRDKFYSSRVITRFLVKPLFR